MSEDPFVLIRNAINQRSEFSFRIGGSVTIFRPYVLYESPPGQLWVAGLTDYGLRRCVTVAQLESLALTGRHFDPDTTFDLSDPVYRNGHATVADL